MAKKPTDDFDNNIEAIEEDWETTEDDVADFGSDPHRRSAATASADHEHDDSDFVEDDMNDIVDEGDPRAESEEEADFSEDDFAEEAEPQTEPQKSKLSGLVFYAIIAAVVGFGGYMAYNSVFKQNERNAPAVAEVPERSTAEEMKIVVPTDGSGPIPVPPTAEEGERPATAQGWQTNLAAEPTPAPAPVAAPVAASVTAVPAPVDPQLLQTIAGLNSQVANMNNKVAQMTTELGTFSANASQIAQTQQTQASQIKALEERPVAKAANGTTVTRDPSMVNDITALKAQIKALEARPVATAVPATNGTVSGASAAEVTALRSQVSDLQKQITQLKTAMEQQKRTVVAATTPVAAAPAPAKTAKPKAEPRVSKTVEVVEEQVEQPRSPKARAAVTPTPTRSTWVLRAATPGMAWVSPKPGSAELKRVVVGEQLDGIGQVQSIRQEGGRWLVEGSNGIIR